MNNTKTNAATHTRTRRMAECSKIAPHLKRHCCVSAAACSTVSFTSLSCVFDVLKEFSSNVNQHCFCQPPLICDDDQQQ